MNASNLQPPTLSATKPLASVSLDLDNQWSYMKTHGDQGWEEFPSYLDLVVPSVLENLEAFGLKITFFVVGQDAALDKNQDMLMALAEKGHEIANHSFHHEPWLHLYPKDRLEAEILQADEHICRATGQKPVGFRGPGFAWSTSLLEVLAGNRYVYDASILPTYLGPIARLYYFWKSELSKEEREKRNKLYGSLKDGLRPVKPYCWQLVSGDKLLEIPITTVPIIKTPFHLSYLLYLSRFSTFLMLLYLKTALALCRLTHTGPSFLLHPLDFLSGEQVPELRFFPGMDLGFERKRELFKKVIKILSKDFTLVSMIAHAKSVLNDGDVMIKHAE